MANIIYEEKRFLNIGEVCAINLKDIKPAFLTLEPEAKEYFVNFYLEKNGVSLENDITFVKYLGNGFFMDFVSDQLFMSEIFNGDDFGTDEFFVLDKKSQDELIKMQEYWVSIQNPQNIEQFRESFSIFMNNPLAIDVAKVPFMTINSDIAKKFASQSLEQIKSKIVSAKIKAQQGLQQQYNKFVGEIVEHYHNVENTSTPKVM